MNHSHEFATWQELLGYLIADSRRKEELAAAVHVRPVTLQRWVEGISKPREDNIRTLLKKLPAEIYPLFMRLLLRSFPELLQDALPVEHFHAAVPNEFYARALSNIAMTPQPMYRPSMQELLLQQPLEHLDPDRRGMSITIAACVPPRYGRKVRSLREVGGLGTAPWPHNLASRSMFLGAEALVGQAVGEMRPFVINSKHEMTFSPVRWTEFERSAAAFPLFLRGQLAGGLIVSSAQEFFFTDERLSLIEDYSYLMSCIFEMEDTYPATQIELQIMPAYDLQMPYFRHYNQRVSQKFVELAAEQQPVTIQQVSQLVWQEIEDELLLVSLSTDEPGDQKGDLKASNEKAQRVRKRHETDSSAIL